MWHGNYLSLLKNALVEIYGVKYSVSLHSSRDKRSETECFTPGLPDVMNVVKCNQTPRWEGVTEIIFLISQQKHMLWVLKRTVSMRRFF